MPLKTLEKILIIGVAIVIIAIIVWLGRLWYLTETQRKEVETLLGKFKEKAKQELPAKQEFPLETFSPEELLEKSWPGGQEQPLPSPADLFRGPEQPSE